MPIVPIDPMCAKKLVKVKGQNYWFFIFFENIAQTKIVEHKIIYKKGPYTFFTKDHHS